ncbi:ABC transporter permease [Butyrivibrio sp. WCD3002]|jgi:NitT/TauT family transport system permease protein|uniref:ABC transporter permease n=1 Tax=Butyrivibrio sp. WCD3002 TaxID=1280676 RepID=UPI0003F53815|nr:ABC transporter permease subunit [Butyrivibrio sp. WCD3002]
MTKFIKNVVAAVFWLFVWQIIALIVHNKVLLAGPIEAFNALIRMAGEAEFWQSVSASYLHIIAGIFIGILLGGLLSVLSYKNELIEMFLSPLVLALKSIPVASIIILILIWVGSDFISTFISALVALPIMYVGMKNGFSSADKKLLEMAHVYRMPPVNQFRFIYLPALFPSLLSAISLAVGMGFKSGIAAEVIGQPLLSMGNGLYRAKIYLDTGDVFAWTFVIILVSWITEKIVMLLLSLVKKGGGIK